MVAYAVAMTILSEEVHPAYLALSMGYMCSIYWRNDVCRVFVIILVSLFSFCLLLRCFLEDIIALNNSIKIVIFLLPPIAF